MRISITAGRCVTRARRRDVTRSGDEAITPHFSTALVVADEILLLVDRSSARAVATYKNVAGFSIRAGFGLRCSSKECDGCDGDGNDCVFHMFSVTCVTLASTKRGGIYSEKFCDFFYHHASMLKIHRRSSEISVRPVKRNQWRVSGLLLCSDAMVMVQ